MPRPKLHAKREAVLAALKVATGTFTVPDIHRTVTGDGVVVSRELVRQIVREAVRLKTLRIAGNNIKGQKLYYTPAPRLRQRARNASLPPPPLTKELPLLPPKTVVAHVTVTLHLAPSEYAKLASAAVAQDVSPENLAGLIVREQIATGAL